MPEPLRNLSTPASAENWQTAGFGLYVHWPFCQAKCPYCDFNSHVVANVDQSRWRAALRAEIARYGNELPGRRLDSIFFGGGTPSLMEPETVADVIEAAFSVWEPASGIEITLEANPTSAEARRFRGYADAGVNRLSIGVQSLDDAALKLLGRLHSAEEALAALKLARGIFARVSFDLIYARQHQTLEDWREELTRAIGLGPDHLSLYQLTIEDGTAFGDRLRRGRLPGLPDDDLAAEMYLLTQDICAAAGLPAYEISNHARPGFEGRHNLIYWRQGDYVGVGPGAHGRFTREGRRLATETPLQPGAWLEAVETRGSGETLRAEIGPEEQAGDYLMMSLRLAEGCDLGRLASFNAWEPDQAILETLVGEELLRLDSGRLRLTGRGRPVLNAILRELLPDG